MTCNARTQHNLSSELVLQGSLVEGREKELGGSIGLQFETINIHNPILKTQAPTLKNPNPKP